MLVDGKGAYFPVDFQNAGSGSFPSSPTPALSVDSSNGLGSVTSQQNLGACAPGCRDSPGPRSAA